MKHIGTQSIETKRLILRRFIINDARQMYDNWAGDEIVTRYLTWQPHTNAGFTESLLKGWVENYNKPDYYQWCIEFKENSQAIGSIAVVNIRGAVGEVELGYCIGRRYSGRGLMSEAVSAVNEYMFGRVEADRVVIIHDVNNPASGRVAKKCGYTHEGTLRRAAVNQQGICDISVWSILKDEYVMLTNAEK